MQSLWRYFQQISSPVSTEKEQNKLPYMPKKKKNTETTRTEMSGQTNIMAAHNF